MKIGIIGVGNIGGTLAEKFVAAGHEVRLANSRGPDSLSELAAQIGGIATSLKGAVEGADAVVISVPYQAIEKLPADLFVNTPEELVVIDTGNYYPIRDGKIEALDGEIADTEWVARHFGRPVVKAFNSIGVNSLRSKGKPRGSTSRVALPVCGDGDKIKRIVYELVEDAGFEPLDAGSLAESWRQQPGTGAYTTDLDAVYLRKAIDILTEQDRKLLPERRESNLKMILSLKDGPGSAESVRALRTLWNLPEHL
jgi:hypothetical protein